MVSASPLGIIAPKGMSKAIVQKLHDAFKNAMEDSEQIGKLVQKLIFLGRTLD